MGKMRYKDSLVWITILSAILFIFSLITKSTISYVLITINGVVGFVFAVISLAIKEK
jgi:hypothetical protein